MSTLRTKIGPLEQLVPQGLLEELVAHQGELATGPIHSVGVLKLAKDLLAARRLLDLTQPAPTTRRLFADWRDKYAVGARVEVLTLYGGWLPGAVTRRTKLGTPEVQIDAEYRQGTGRVVVEQAGHIRVQRTKRSKAGGKKR